MADPLKKTASESAPEGISSAVKAPSKRQESSKELREGRGDIAKTLGQTETADGQGEVIESGEVREVSSEGSEQKGDGSRQQQKGDDDDGQQAGQSGAFTFDEKNLPPVPEMIAKIEQHLRKEIRNLGKKAAQYRGGIFRKADYPKYSETICEIRKKHVLLRRLAHMAAELIKSLFLQLFGGKKAS